MKQEKNISKGLIKSWLMTTAEAIKFEQELHERLSEVLMSNQPTWEKLDVLSEWANYTFREEEEVNGLTFSIMRDFYRGVKPWQKVEGVKDEFVRAPFVVRANVFDRVIEVRYSKPVYMLPEPVDANESLKVMRREAIRGMENGKSMSYAALKITEFEEMNSFLGKGILYKQIRFFNNLKVLKTEKGRNSWIKDYDKLMREKAVYNVSRNRVIDRFERDADYIYQSGLFQFLQDIKKNTDFTIRFTNIPSVIGNDFGMGNLAMPRTA